MSLWKEQALMTSVPLLIASDPKLWQFLRDMLWPVSGLIILLLVAAVAVVWIRHRCRDHEDRAAMAAQMLQQLRELHREGDLSDEEFRSIKSRLVPRFDTNARDGLSGDCTSLTQSRSPEESPSEADAE